MNTYRWTTSAIQPTKTKKVGFFIFCSRSGLIHRIELFTGHSSDAAVTSDFRNWKVWQCCESTTRWYCTAQKRKNYKVLFDNWFTSPALMIELPKKGFSSLGTQPLYRAPWLSFSTDREMPVHGRGSFEEKVCNVDEVQLTAILWYDNKSVKVISTFVWGRSCDKHKPLGSQIQNQCQYPMSCSDYSI